MSRRTMLPIVLVLAALAAVAVWVRIRRRRVTNGHNALKRVPAEFAVRPAVASPECDPILARAIVDVYDVLQRITQRALEGLMTGAVLVKTDDYAMLVRAWELLQIGLDRANVADGRVERSDERQDERRERYQAS